MSLSGGSVSEPTNARPVSLASAASGTDFSRCVNSFRESGESGESRGFLTMRSCVVFTMRYENMRAGLQ